MSASPKSYPTKWYPQGLRAPFTGANECQDCGEETKRRTRCKRCGWLLCNWCYGHVHTLPDPALYCSNATMKAADELPNSGGRP